VTLSLTTRLAPFDFQVEPIDAAIHFGPANWQGGRLDFLMNETVVPVCSPQLAESRTFKAPADLVKAPLLHVVSRPCAWEQWFNAMGVQGGEPQGMLVDQFAVAAQAAISGIGVALLPKFLIESELEHGELQLALDRPMESADHYHLAWPPNRENYPPLQAFRSWIQEEAKRYVRGSA
jgi:LysR family transcriptional regulator, glycine cleavage system transcriptional activator